jgi:EAL domain-containing protein (putative c-di-GMP-specific phosphodiesterase class I)
MIAPETTIGIAEQSGQINQIGKWVLTRACLDRRGWRQNGRSEQLAVSVNVSVRQLMAAGFSDLVADVLAQTDTDPAMVTLEVTESVFIPDADRALVVLSALKDLGLPIALDDFGTGYSSLSYLKLYPIDVVKIDRSFVAGVDRDKTSRAIVRAVVQLAHGLRMKVVGEGVETVAQHEEIAALGCDAFQGYLFARPALTTELDAIVNAANDHKWPQARLNGTSQRTMASRTAG